MTPRFLSGASGRMALPLAEVGRPVVRVGILRAQIGRIRVLMPIRHTMPKSCQQLDRGVVLREV